WGAKDLVEDPARLKPIQLLSLSPPPDMRRECLIIEGASLAEKAEKLAAVIMEIR
ncbi:MAG: hypothetical protein HY892_22465, partial [Deltaproteobacteria bacterium]|nr:hypothetical protein [Deltaproteobacteria bacterium]MBI5586583.1 hypothetical protein [Deltaproteobacteria bacterium]